MGGLGEEGEIPIDSWDLLIAYINMDFYEMAV